MVRSHWIMLASDVTAILVCVSVLCDVHTTMKSRNDPLLRIHSFHSMIHDCICSNILSTNFSLSSFCHSNRMPHPPFSSRQCSHGRLGVIYLASGIELCSRLNCWNEVILQNMSACPRPASHNTYVWPTNKPEASLYSPNKSWPFCRSSRLEQQIALR